MDQAGLVLVALKSQEHPLAPRGVEPAVEAHVIADEDGVDLNPPVRLLQQILHLQVLQVRLEADVVLGGVSHLGLAEPLAQHVAGVAAAAARAVVGGAAQAGGAIAERAGQEAVAGHLVVGTGARVGLLRKAAQEPILVAVEEGLDAVEPVVGRPAAWKELVFNKERSARSKYDFVMFYQKEKNKAGFSVRLRHDSIGCQIVTGINCLLTMQKHKRKVSL